MGRRVLPFAPAQLPTDAPPSWNDTAAMATILAFVEGVMDPASDTCVASSDRVAVFDDDGTFRCKDCDDKDQRLAAVLVT